MRSVDRRRRSGAFRGVFHRRSPERWRRLFCEPLEDRRLMAQAPRELVLLDAAVPNQAAFLEELASRSTPPTVQMVAADRDGFDAITAILAGYDNLQAIHVVSHGGPGFLQLGASLLSLASLESNAAAISVWGQALSPDGDLLLWGCDVAEGASGEAFVQRLAGLTGADVAASANITGQGGDWELEYRSGPIESAGLDSDSWISTNFADSWQGRLESFNQIDNVVLDKQRSSGSLQMQMITGYNLVVDSNVETPATKGPEAAHLGVIITNTSKTTTLENVTVNICDMLDLSAVTGTPGIYPTTVVSSGYAGGYSGNFSLTHSGGAADATRVIRRLAPGESTTQYFLVSYSRVDASNNSVTGSAPVTADDLKLYFDVWASAQEGAQTRNVYEERRVTARNEISAMANKIWPNTTAKVPPEYLDAIATGLGWRPSSTPRIPGALISEGIWYDFGNVGAGFDNDGDLVPDRNGWMQPVGDVALYNSGCVRLAKSYGLLVISLNDGTEQLVPFEDKLYFEYVPENNTGVVGWVFYEYLPLGSSCSAGLSPYQEVASGYDNEKFNADYGAGITFLNVGMPNAQFDKSAPPLATKDQDLVYTLTVTNTATTNSPENLLGFTNQGAPVTVEDAIPSGTTYVLGSATANNTVPSGNTAIVTYYNGSTWLATEPSLAADVKRVRWVLSEPLAAQQSATFHFTSHVSANFSAATVDNCGNLSLGGVGSLASDCTQTKITAALGLSGTVFRDNGLGGGVVGDGIRNGTETFLPSVDVSLYLDDNGNGKVDTGELLWATTTSSTLDGAFAFNSLPAAKWVVVTATRATDTDVPVGYVPSTATKIPVTLSTANVSGVTFGFAPTLDLTKTLVGTSTTVNEGARISYDLKIDNLLKPESYAITTPHTQVLWMNSATSTTWTTPANAAGAANSTFASTSNDGNVLVATQPIDDSTVPNSTPVTHVEAVLRLRVSSALASDETLSLTVTKQGVAVGTYTISLNAINAFVNSVGEVSVNVTNANWNWTSLLAANTGLSVTYNESGTSPQIDIDSLGLRVVSQVAENRSGNVYWSDTTTTLKVGPTSGGEVEILIPSLSVAPTDIAFDTQNNTVWIASGTTIGKYTPDGNLLSSFTAQGAVTGLAMDPTAGYIYWSEASAIRRANLDGTGSTAIYSSGLTNLQGLTIDTESHQLFWVRSNGNNVLIQRGSASGGSTTTLLNDVLGANGNSNPLDIEFDHTSNTLYFSNDSTGSLDDYIGAVGIDGANPRRVVSGIVSPRGLAVSPADNLLVWGDSTGIKKATLDGGGVTTVLPNLANISDVELPLFTVDSVGVFDVNRTLATVPLTDDYNPAELRFVSASVEPTSVDTATGFIRWTNVGPINPSMSKTVRVTFDVLQPTGNATNTNVVNTAEVTNAKLADGGSASDDLSAVTIAVEPTATIGDLVWSDKNGNGARDAGEPGIAGVTVELLNGTTVLQTTTTDATGAYQFTGLTVADGTSVTYKVQVATSSLPTGATQTFDADGTGTASASSFTFSNPAGTTGPADNLTQDFGYRITNVFFGNVWRDYDGNGLRAGYDLGMSSVTVELRNSSGALTATTTTDSSGNFYFRGIADGSYRVVVLPATLPTLGTWTQTADPDATTDNQGVLTTVANGDVAGSFSFGYRVAGTNSIGDQVFFDWDSDGVQDAIDEGIRNVTVRLYLDPNESLDPSVDPLVATTVTDSTGGYLFNNLPDGHYTVVVDRLDPDFPAGVAATTANPQSVLTLSGTAHRDADFGYLPFGTGAISGTVWNDANLNATRSTSESTLPSITVTLQVDLNGDGNYVAIATAVSDTSGAYRFADLPLGAYRVVVDTADADLPRSSAGRTFTATTATQPTRTLTSVSPSTTADFGFAGLPFIGDFVYYDGNRNGTQESFEQGIGGVTLDLYLDSNGNGLVDAGETAIATTVTATGTGSQPVGFYQFLDLSPNAAGQYYLVRVRTGAGSPVNGLLNSGDPDRDGIAWTGTTSASLPDADSSDSRILLTTASYTGADIGYAPTSVIGDRVWLDFDRDGVQDPAELGIAGVTVTASKSGTTYTTTTDADGFYQFAGLADGAWTIAISGSALTGKTATYDADGIGTVNSAVATLSGGSVTNTVGSMGFDFGLGLAGSRVISGTVCTADANVQGLCDDIDNFLDDGLDFDIGPTDERELSGFSVYLYTAAGALLGSTTTDDQGNYAFNYLPDGTYQVVLNRTLRPLDRAVLTTDAADTAAMSVTDYGTSVVQSGIAVAGADVTDVDFAFLSTVSYDFGDLPAGYDSTSILQDGARHEVPVGGATIYLGTAPDVDIDGAGNAFASVDDVVDGNDDEDGVVPLNVLSWTNGASGGTVQVTIPAGRSGYLAGWIDFNHDLSLIDSGEFIIGRTITGTGAPQTITFDIPTGVIGASSESWLARFRIFAATPAYPLFSYEGEAFDGEVEDYLIERPIGSSIGDYVWNDIDGDGVQDINEPGLSGVQVELRQGGTLIATQFTGNGLSDVDGDGVIDPVGFYRFPGLASGTYTVSLTIPAGFAANYDPDTGLASANGAASVSLASGTQLATIDFGLRPLLNAISGSVWNDTNDDGQFGGDTAIGAVRIELWTDPDGDGNPSDGVQVAETYTRTDGTYVFTAIPANRYVVIENDPPSLFSVRDSSGGNDNRIAVNLAGVDSTGNRFLDDGIAQHSIGGYVYNDGGAPVSSGNTFSVDDTGLASVTLSIFIDNDNDGAIDAFDPLVDTMVTNTAGAYVFPNLPAGSYVVRETTPTGYTSELDVQGNATDDLVAVTLATTDVSGRNFLDDESQPTIDLRLDKSIDDSTPVIGQTVTFTIVVTNDGPDPATGVVVSDPLPAGFGSVSQISSGGSLTAGTITWSGLSIAAGSGNATTLSFKAVVLANAAVPSGYTNWARVTAANERDSDSSPANASTTEDDDDDAPLTIADLSLAKTVSKATPSVGDELTFTITVTNAGPDAATGVGISDAVPAGFTAIQAISNGGSVASGVVSWTNLSIPASSSLAVTFKATVAVSSSANAYTNTARVTASEPFDPDSIPGNSLATEDDQSSVTVAVQQADLSLTKSISDNTPTVGQTVTFTITVVNDGPITATGVVVTDFVPAGFGSISNVSHGGSLTSGNIIWSGLSVPAGAENQLELTFDAVVIGGKASTAYENWVRITAADQLDPDSDPTNMSTTEDDDASVHLVISDLSLVKTVSNATPQVGAVVTFTITVSNAGPDAATGVAVRDALPA
ncbi:MAG: SdrD B-like domain-containing protein, partial [Planctomycetota bacterium]